MTNKELVEFLTTAYGNGEYGGAAVHVYFTCKLPLSETTKIKDAFRPKLEEELAHLKAMKKHDLNKNYFLSFVKADIKLDGEKIHGFEINKCCRHRISANGHRINEVMSINDIFKLPIYSCSTSSMGYTTRYKALDLNEDGTYTLTLKDVVRQDPIPSSQRRRNWPRKALQSSFIKHVKEYIATKENEGWMLIGNGINSQHGYAEYALSFEKTPIDDSKLNECIQPNEFNGQQPIYFNGIEVMPEKKDIDRISKIINECGDDHAKAISKAALMNSKITDRNKRLRRKAACIAVKANWLANCFS